MVLAIFMAMIVIGFLYYLVGLGDAILAQERMQDAADATAFSSAVIHARGMNVLAMLNIIMASMLAILVLMGMIVSLLQLGILVLGAAGFLIPGLWAGISPLKKTQDVVSKIESRLTKPVEKAVQGIHKIQGPLSKAIPIIANVNAMKLARESYGPVVEAGLTFPILSGLPTVEGETETLCRKAGEYAGEMAAFPITAILKEIGGKPGSYLADFLVDKAKSVGGAYGMYYCGLGPKPPAPSHPVDKGLPEINSTSGATCKSQYEMTESKRDAACKQHDKELESLKTVFSIEEGKCISNDSNLKDLCKQNLNKAREDCNPNEHSRSNYRWRTRTVTQRYDLKGTRVVAADPEIEAREHEVEKINFLGHPDMCQRAGSATFAAEEQPLSDEWNFVPVEPVCTSEIKKAPEAAEFAAIRKRTIVRKHREVTDILGCTKRVTIKSELPQGGFTEEMKKRPQDMCSCAAQGDNMFQVRSVVYGDPKAFTSDSDKRILVATGGQKVEQGAVGDLGMWAGKFAAAQAEFYFDTGGDDSLAKKSEWLWHMNWKARMRRLQKRPAYECTAKKNTCPGGKTTASSALVKRVNKLLEDASSTVISH